MITRISLLTICIVLCSCMGTPRPSTREVENRRFHALAAAAQMTVVDTSDGVSEVEAFKIACGFFMSGEFVPCGIVWLPKEEGSVWRVPLWEGFAGEHTRDVVVRKSDGSFNVETSRVPQKNA